MIASTVPAEERLLMEYFFMGGSYPENNKSGFLRMRQASLQKGKATLLPASAHVLFSEDQYSEAFRGDKSKEFSARFLETLVPGFNWNNVLNQISYHIVIDYTSKKKLCYFV